MAAGPSLGRGDVRIGISGWRYPPWRGVFYPPKLAQRLELTYAAERMNSLEINGSFYTLQKPELYHRWREQTPDDFVFAVKGGRFITHMKKLRDVEEALANFFASGPLALREKLGPLLWQLPPSLPYDADRLSRFFLQLPRSTSEAAYLARRHGPRLIGRAFAGTAEDRPLRHALEVRHDSYKVPGFVQLLRDFAVSLVVADTAGKWPFLLDVTSDLVYVRLHGDEELYTSGYSPSALEVWAGRIREWTAAGLDVCAYFDNDVKVRAPFDAMALAERVTAAGV